MHITHFCCPTTNPVRIKRPSWPWAQIGQGNKFILPFVFPRLAWIGGRTQLVHDFIPRDPPGQLAQKMEHKIVCFRSVYLTHTSKQALQLKRLPCCHCVSTNGSSHMEQAKAVIMAVKLAAVRPERSRCGMLQEGCLGRGYLKTTSVRKQARVNFC